MFLTLASGSVIRKSLLESAGIALEARPARVDEEAIRAALLEEGAPPRDIVDALAEQKARRIAAKAPDGLVLGCDQVLELDGAIFSKPADRAAAADQLNQLSGNRHRLLSAAVLYEGSKPVWRTIGEAQLTMHRLREEEIETYLDHTWPQVSDSVGAYKAEEFGARLFSRIDGDWFSVLGLPLLDLLSYFRLRGWLEP